MALFGLSITFETFIKGCRVKTYVAIVKDENIPEPGIPESFKVLIKEMQSLGLDVKVLSEDNKEIEIKEANEMDGVSSLESIIDMEAVTSEEELEASGYSEENSDDDDLDMPEEFVVDNFDEEF